MKDFAVNNMTEMVIADNTAALKLFRFQSSYLTEESSNK